MLRRASGRGERRERDDWNVWTELVNQGGVEVSGGGWGENYKSGVKGSIRRG